MTGLLKPSPLLRLYAMYGMLVLLTIILGLLSRHFTIIPLWVGSALWGLMVYFIIRFLFIRATVLRIAAISLIFSYAIEFSQLYQASWIVAIRQTLFGRMVLGQGFEWGDLLAYTLGIIIGASWDRMVMRPYKSALY